MTIGRVVTIRIARKVSRMTLFVPMQKKTNGFMSPRPEMWKVTSSTSTGFPFLFTTRKYVDPVPDH